LESTHRLPTWSFSPSAETLKFLAVIVLLAVIGLGLWRLRRLEAGMHEAKLEEQVADMERRKYLAHVERRLTELINHTGGVINGRVAEVQRDLERLDRRVAASEAVATEQYAKAIREAGPERALAALEEVAAETPAYKNAKDIIESLPKS